MKDIQENNHHHHHPHETAISSSSSGSSSSTTTRYKALRRYAVPSPPHHQNNRSNHKHRKLKKDHYQEGTCGVTTNTADKSQANVEGLLPDIYKKRKIPRLNICNLKEEEHDEKDNSVQEQQQPPLTDRAIYDRIEQQKMRKKKKKKRTVAQSVDYSSMRRHFDSSIMESIPSIRREQRVREEFVMHSVPLVVNSAEAIQKQMYNAQRREKKIEKKSPIVEEVEEEREPMVINRMIGRGVFGVM